MPSSPARYGRWGRSPSRVPPRSRSPRGSVAARAPASFGRQAPRDGRGSRSGRRAGRSVARGRRPCSRCRSASSSLNDHSSTMPRFIKAIARASLLSESSVTESASRGVSSGPTSRRAASRSPRRRASSSRTIASRTAKPRCRSAKTSVACRSASARYAAAVSMECCVSSTKARSAASSGSDSASAGKAASRAPMVATWPSSERLRPWSASRRPAPLPVAGGLGVTDRVDRVPMMGEPVGGGQVQIPDGVGFAAPKLQGQEIREQRVVAEPRALTIDRNHERVRVLQLDEHPLRAARPGHSVGQRAADPLQDRGAEQQLPDPFGLALEDLGKQVIRHRPLAAGELGDELSGVRVTGQRHRGEPQARGPPLGPRQEHGGVLGRQLDPGCVKELLRLIGREPEVDGAELGQLASQAESMESQRWVMAGGEDHVQQWWPLREQELQVCLSIRRDQLLKIVDDEYDWRIERTELRDQPPHQRLAVEPWRWLERLNESVHADRGAQRLDDRQPEALGVAFVALHQHPGRSCAEARLHRSTSEAARSFRCRAAPRRA